MPAIFDPVFRPCAPADGAATLQLFEDETLQASAGAEWIAKADGTWDIQFTNALGALALSIERRGHAVFTEGSIAHRLPHFAVDDNGYLNVDGSWAGILASEVPCFLGFGLPRAWAARLSAVERDGKETVVTIDDPERDIEITSRAVKDGQRDRICARVSWSRWLVIRRHVTWCTSASGRPQAELRGLARYSIKWTRVDES